MFQASAIRENAHWQSGVTRAFDPNLARLLVGVDFHPLQRHIAAMQEIPMA